MSAVELTVLPVSDQCKGLLGSDSIWWRPRSKCSPDATTPSVLCFAGAAPNPLGNIFDDFDDGRNGRKDAAGPPRPTCPDPHAACTRTKKR